MIYIMPGLLYSGLSFPNFRMDEYAEFFSQLMPISYAGDSLRDVLLLGYAPHLFNDCRSMILFGLISYLITIMIFTAKTLLRKESRSHAV